MPELPEVEVVRRGLDRWVRGRTVVDVQVLHCRSIRRHVGGAADFAARLAGRRIVAVDRRGKYFWFLLGDDAGADEAAPVDEALYGHLGMSGQFRIEGDDAPDQAHLRVRMRLQGKGIEPTGNCQVRFVDQRTFGGLAIAPLAPTADGLPAGVAGQPLLPEPLTHIARDALDPHLDEQALFARFRARRTGVKRALLDQSLVSGIGNIYADEALWRARLHYARPTETLRRTELTRLLAAVREVMTQSLSQGGTSFDALYVNVNGESGYFDRSLAVYGQRCRPCPRCGTPVRRDHFMNRSAYLCPKCQPRPRRAHW
ncbi:MAG: DNA-formamidopyrimidine glycosylase [Micrococcales bacterium]|nr:MAG: DNA-formamidopyrimidine glycosylase [Micrococcales bacterium]PIE26713.1 MAG: DNA-formamidopyrimidine glycosylase [Micrococcales bacterium]